MFGTIRKHQKWLWAVIMTFTIISFVIFFSPYSRVNSSVAGSGNYGSIFGKKVTQQEYANAMCEVYLHYFFMSTGRWPDEDRTQSRFDPERESYQWLMLVRKQDEAGIHVSDEDAAKMARRMIQSLSRKQEITMPMFQQIIAQRQVAGHRLDLDDLQRYIGHFLGMQQLIGVYGISGRLITPKEGQALYERENQKLATEAVFFPSSNYLAAITVTPEQVSGWYSNRLVSWIIPEKIQVKYVKFALTNYQAAAETEMSTNLNEMVEQNMKEIGTNYARISAKTAEEARTKIREELLRQKEVALASKPVKEFMQALGNFPTNLAVNLEVVARSNNVPVDTTLPFDEMSEPAGLKVGSDFAKAAFALTADEPLSVPILGEDGIYILARDKQFPRETPPLEQVETNVVADLKHYLAATNAVGSALTFYRSVTNSLAQGKSFSNCCAEASLTRVPLPPFSLSTQNLTNIEGLVALNALKQTAFGTEVGKAGMAPMEDVVPTRNQGGAMVLYVESKLPVDVAKMQEEMPRFMDAVRQKRQQEAFDDWFRKEAQKGLVDTPIFRQPPPEMGSTSKAKS
jgi:hypothetical protein